MVYIAQHELVNCTCLLTESVFGSDIKVRLSRNMCLLLTAILHFIHGMTDPVLMSLSASHVSSVRRHFPVLVVSMALFVLPVVLTYALWHHYALNTWLFAVTAFCVELCLKVRMHISLCDKIISGRWTLHSTRRLAIQDTKDKGFCFGNFTNSNY